RPPVRAPPEGASPSLTLPQRQLPPHSRWSTPATTPAERPHPRCRPPLAPWTCARPTSHHLPETTTGRQLPVIGHRGATVASFSNICSIVIVNATSGALVKRTVTGHSIESAGRG